MFNSMYAQWELQNDYPAYRAISVTVTGLYIFVLHVVTNCTPCRRQRAADRCRSRDRHPLIGAFEAVAFAFFLGGGTLAMATDIFVNIFIAAMLENFDLDEDEKLRIQYIEYTTKLKAKNAIAAAQQYVP